MGSVGCVAQRDYPLILSLTLTSVRREMLIPHCRVRLGRAATPSTRRLTWKPHSAYLNWLFIQTGTHVTLIATLISSDAQFSLPVNARLLSQGLERYRPLVRFNIQLIFVSIAMDGESYDVGARSATNYLFSAQS